MCVGMQQDVATGQAFLEQLQGGADGKSWVTPAVTGLAGSGMTTTKGMLWECAGVVITAISRDWPGSYSARQANLHKNRPACRSRLSGCR